MNENTKQYMAIVMRDMPLAAYKEISEAFERRMVATLEERCKAAEDAMRQLEDAQERLRLTDEAMKDAADTLEKMQEGNEGIAGAMEGIDPGPTLGELPGYDETLTTTAALMLLGMN